MIVRVRSGAGRLRDVEAVLQHLKARYDIACDRQNDRELRRGNLVGRLEPALSAPMIAARLWTGRSNHAEQRDSFLFVTREHTLMGVRLPEKHRSIRGGAP